MKKIIALICAIALSLGTPIEATTIQKDVTAPLVTKTNPQKYSKDNMIESTISLRFSENITKGTAFSRISIQDKYGKQIIFTPTFEKNIVKLAPKYPLSYKTTYTITIPKAAVKDLSGNALKNEFVMSFDTEEKAAATSINEEKEIINYNIILNADVPGVISSGQKDAIIRELRNLGISARIVSTRDTSVPIEPDVSFENYSYFDIYLDAYGENKVAVINVVKAINGIGLQEAAALVNSAPCYVKRNLPLVSALSFKNQLDETGASVSIFGVESQTADVTDQVSSAASPEDDLDNYLTFDVVLDSVGYQKTEVIRAVRTITALSLSEANDLVNSAPCFIERDISRADAETCKAMLEDAGATVRIIGVEKTDEEETDIEETDIEETP